jgi:hypothetical protein
MRNKQLGCKKVIVRKHNSSTLIETITHVMNSMTISHDVVSPLTTWKQKIKDNDILYFVNLAKEFTSGRFLMQKEVQFDSEFFYMIGKYASPALYTLLANINIFETTDNLRHILEGIAHIDNHYLFKHMIEINTLTKFHCESICQYTTSLIENSAYNTMRLLLSSVSKYCLPQFKIEFVEYIKLNMSRVIDNRDSRMLTIFTEWLMSL